MAGSVTAATIFPSVSLAVPCTVSSGMYRQRLPVTQRGFTVVVPTLRIGLRNGSRLPDLFFVIEEAVVSAGFFPAAVFCSTILGWTFFCTFCAAGLVVAFGAVFCAFLVVFFVLSVLVSTAGVFVAVVLVSGVLGV